MAARTRRSGVMSAVVALIAMFVAACAPVSGSQTTSSTTRATTTTTSIAEDDPCLSGDLPFGTSGPLAALGEDTGDATVLAGIRWEGHPGCERVMLDFFSEGGSPASTLGPAGAIALGESGVLRITLPPEISVSAVADTTLDGTLAKRAYVARDADGAMIVDLHLTTDVPVEARAFDVASPVRLVVDLRPASAPPLLVAPPTVGDDVVVLAPAPGAGLYPLRVTGYAGPDVDAVTVRIYQDGDVALERAVSTIGPRDAWESFDVRLADGPSGPVDMYVGPVDAFGEPTNGVTVPLELP